MSKNDSSRGPLDWIIVVGIILLGLISAAAVLTENHFFLN